MRPHLQVWGMGVVFSPCTQGLRVFYYNCSNPLQKPYTFLERSRKSRRHPRVSFLIKYLHQSQLTDFIICFKTCFFENASSSLVPNKENASHIGRYKHPNCTREIFFSDWARYGKQFRPFVGFNYQNIITYRQLYPFICIEMV